MVSVEQEIEKLLRFAEQAGWLDSLDVIVSRNALYDLFAIQEPKLLEQQMDLKLDQPLDSLEAAAKKTGELSPAPILDRLLDAAAERGMLPHNTTTYRDLLDARIMGLLVPRSSEITRRFWQLAENEGIERATDWFYRFSQQTNYIRMDRIANNEYWTVNTSYGELEITINLSKPEKDPQEIAALKEMPKSSYPQCVLCLENIGYTGRLDHPARQNHRVIPLDLLGENWYLQYSPYVYYNEHSILFSEEHRPMRIDRKAFERLLTFVERFPHYFAGSNADLPIVGGSILSHDHYQGGRHRFAMEKAPIDQWYVHPDFPGVRIGRVKWPLSVLRIQTSDKRLAVDMAEHIWQRWKRYSDPQADLLHETKQKGQSIPHNTVTPIARFNDSGEYEFDIVLRNNRTSAEHPEGIFHPHRELHHIKKENIGLIEVMGLAVLPGRLKRELEQIADWLIQSEHHRLPERNEPLHLHADWMKELAEKYRSALPMDQADLLKKLREEVGHIFVTVLEHCGVFKRTPEGEAAFARFVTSIGMKET